MSYYVKNAAVYAVMISALLSTAVSSTIDWNYWGDTFKYYTPYAFSTIPATAGTAIASNILTDPYAQGQGGYLSGLDLTPGYLGLGVSALTAPTQAYMMYNKRAALSPEERAASRWAYLGFPASQAATTYAAAAGPQRAVAPYIMAPSVISSLIALLTEYYYDLQAAQQANNPNPPQQQP